MRTGTLPPLNWLRAFEAAARHLSFTAAAEELHITQSAVSQQIKSLETALGRNLFVRRTRSLQLTDAARAYLPSVQGAFQLLLDETAAIAGQDRESLLEVHSNMAFTVFWLTPRLGEFLDAYPWVRLNVATSVFTNEYTAPYASVEIRFGSGTWEGTQGEVLHQSDAYPVCTPEIAKRLKTPEDVLNEKLFDTIGGRQSWDSWFRAAGVTPDEPPEQHWASTYVVTFDLAARGVGITLGHDLIVEDFLADGRLVRPFDIGFPMPDAYYLLTPPDARLNRAAKVFREWLLDRIRSDA